MTDLKDDVIHGIRQLMRGIEVLGGDEQAALANDLRASSKHWGVYLERPGVISPGAVWICFTPGYMYSADTLPDLLHVVDTEWEWDRHLVG